MIRLTSGKYISNINGHFINLYYQGNNKCDIYVNGVFQGNFSFNEAKHEINKIEQQHRSWNEQLLDNYQFPVISKGKSHVE